MEVHAKTFVLIMYSPKFGDRWPAEQSKFLGMAFSAFNVVISMFSSLADIQFIFPAKWNDLQFPHFALLFISRTLLIMVPSDWNALPHHFLWLTSSFRLNQASFH